MHIPRIIVNQNQFNATASELQSSFTAPRNPEPLLLTLDEKQNHHLQHVLRKKVNCEIEILVREQLLLFRGIVSEFHKKKAYVNILEQLQSIVPHPKVTIMLGQANNKSLEQAIQQGTETGVSRFIIYPAEHTGKKVPINLARLNLIADNAVEQARLCHIPEILYLPSLAEALNSVKNANAVKFLCNSPNEPKSEATQDPDITELFPRSQKKPSDPNSLLEEDTQSVEIYIAVGPEGGFSLFEIELHLSKGFRATSLGPYVARVETAVVIAAGISRLTARNI